MPANYTIRQVIIFAVLLVVVFFSYLTLPPRNFPIADNISVGEGWTINDTAAHFKSINVVHSSLLLRLAVSWLGDKRGVMAGDYSFERPLSTLAIAHRLTRGLYTAEPVKVTIPEGFTVREIADTLYKRLTKFDAEEFIELAKESEGELFPDTYFFTPTTKPETVIREMKQNFRQKISEHSSAILASGRSLNEILVMASILEEEAKDNDARRVIAGILWKRFDNGMPLQVDAVFPYILGKSSFDLTMSDLAYDSPYNTYVYKGLPPGPITNPGLDSILAALEPEKSPYWFYLSDYHGRMHYAVNFDEHKTNKARYLN